MGLSVIVGGVALVPAGLALTLRPYVPTYVTALLSHAALTGFAVALAASSPLCDYTTWLLQKGADGHIGLLSRIMFWPYHLGLRVKLHTQRRTSREPLYNKVTEQLYIGGWPETGDHLPAAVSAVLDVTCELPRTHNLKYKCLPTWDTKAPSPAEIQSGVEWTVGHTEAGRPVYIHCAHGHGRSATLLAAVLLATGQASDADAAVALMRQSRPRVRLNKVQKAALLAWMAVYLKSNPQQQCSSHGARSTGVSYDGQRSSGSGGAVKRASC